MDFSVHVTALAVLLLMGIASAQELADVEHPWQQPELDDAARSRALRDVTPFMALSEQELVDLIPARKPIYSWAKFPIPGAVSWDPRKPRHITVGSETFIPEERFPATDSLEHTGPDGTVWTYEFFPDANGEPIYPICIRDAAARDQYVEAALNMARLYDADGDADYARRAALIIARFAEVYPAYPIHGRTGSRGQYKFFTTEPYPYTSGKWAQWYPVDLPATEKLAMAYDLIYPSGIIERLGQELGRDLRSEIELGFFADHVELILKFDSWHATSLAMRTHNLHPSKCRGMIAIGRTIGKPEYVHYACLNMKEILEARFMIDGVFPESPDYHGQTAGNLQMAAALMAGYSDPPGYTDELSGKRFDEFDVDREFPMLKRAYQYLDDCTYPDGMRMVVHDTWPRHRPEQARNATTSRLFPAFGHAVLGLGEGPAQMEAHLHFSKGFGHEHNDTLNLALWACGEELLSELGYTYTYRGWATGSLGHNLVVVNGGNQLTQPLEGGRAVENPSAAVGGELVNWFPVEDGFGVVEATGSDAYPECSVYRRTAMLVALDEQHTACVDIFEVTGGSQHDWMAHGSAEKDKTLTFTAPSEPFADSLAEDGQIHIPMDTQEQQMRGLLTEFDPYGKLSQYWGNIRHVSKLSGSGPWQATFAGLQPSDAKLRLHLLAPTDCEVYFGEAPSIRRAKEYLPDIEKYMMPIMTARRTGEDLTSRYVAVWEPFSTEPWLEQVELLHDGSDGLVIRMSAGDTMATVFWTPDSDTTLAADGMSLTGRFGCARVSDGGLRMSACEATRMASGDTEITAEALQPFSIISASVSDVGDQLVLAGRLPEQVEQGQWGILLHPGGQTRAIRLGEITRNADTTAITCPDGLGLVGSNADNHWRETCFPMRTFDGPMQLRIPARMDLATE